MVETILPFLTLLLGIVNRVDSRVLLMEITLDLLCMGAGVPPELEFTPETSVVHIEPGGNHSEESL